MYLDPKEKQEIFAKHGKSAKDTGNTEGQIALFTYRIQHLNGAFESKPQRLQHRAFSSDASR